LNVDLGILRFFSIDSCNLHPYRSQQTVTLVVLNVSSNSSETCQVRRRARRVECVEPCHLTSSTQPKCMQSTRRTCRVVSRRDEPSGIWLMTVTSVNAYSTIK